MGNFVDEIRKHNDISRQNIIKSFGGGSDLIAKAEGNEIAHEKAMLEVGKRLKKEGLI